MLITLLLFSSLLWADDDLSSEKYCFSSESQASSALQKFSAIQVNSDKVTKETNCLIIQMRPHRRELIQKYLLSIYPNTNIEFSSAELQRDPCKLKVEKVKKKVSENTKVNIDQTPSAIQSNSTSNASEIMHIETLKDFELSVNQEQIKGSCRFIRSDSYEVTIEVRRNPKPIVPVELPPGSIVVLNQAPPDQETSVLSTQVQLSRGNKIELGSVIRDLKNKDQGVDVKPSLNNETTSNLIEEKVYLSLH